MNARHVVAMATLALLWGCSAGIPQEAPGKVEDLGLREHDELLQKLNHSSGVTDQARKNQADEHYRLAERCFQAADFEKALLECEKALKLNPGHAPASALHLELQFILGRGKVSPSHEEYKRVLDAAIVRHQSTLVELDNAVERGRRAYNLGDYEQAEREFQKIQEYGKWMPDGIELQTRLKQASEMLERTREAGKSKGADESKSRLRLVEEERARESLRPEQRAVAHEEKPELLVVERAVPLPPQEDFPRGGELRARLGTKAVPLPLKHTDVKARVSLWIASVTLKQEYHNPYAGKIEAVYTFPLPEDAAVRDFVMTIGERQIRGVIREREEAKRIYLEARRQGYVASLVTQDRPNVFTESVANLEPGKRVDVAITYFHALRASEGVFEFVFPMVVGPRFNPPGGGGGLGAVPAGARGASGQAVEIQYSRPEEIPHPDISVLVDIDAGVPIDGVSSASHVIRVERLSPAQARVTLSPNDRIPNKDLVLRWKAAGKRVLPALATHREGATGHFALMIQPPESLGDVADTPREMIFVLDCSGSMQGPPLAAAKRALTRCLRRLGGNDTFQIIRFSDRASTMGAAPVIATPDNVEAGLRYLEGLTSEGGTMMMEGIKAALEAPLGGGRFRIVSFMTDGFVGNDEEVLREVQLRLGPARIFSFGVGSSPNRHLLEGLARVGRGVSAYIGLDETSERVADELYRRIERPALTDVKVDWGGMEAKDVHPPVLPDLFVGKPLLVTGRFTGRGKTAVRITGRLGGKAWEGTLDLDLDDPGLRHSAITSIWARQRIQGLEDEMRGAAQPAEAAGRIKEIGLQYGLVSAFTSFLAVDSLAPTAGDHGTTVAVPVPVPDGVRYETTVGTPIR